MLEFIDDEEKAATAAELFKVMGHPLRLRMVAALCAEPTHVGALAERLEIPQPIVSQHLRILRMRGLVRSERVNGLAVYHLANPHLRQMMGCVKTCVGSDPA